MNKFMVFGFLLLSAPELVMGLDCKSVYAVGVGVAGGKAVRYSLRFKSSCIFIESLGSEKPGKALDEKEVCVLDGKNMESEYTHVDFMTAAFVDNDLYFKLGITHLSLAGVEVKWCKTIFINGFAEYITCSEADALASELE